VEEVVGREPDFTAFARALESAWMRALRPGNTGVFLDTPSHAS
jgi:hypothetical protein